MFVTNNSSKSAVSYVEKLKRLGIEATVEDFLTSVNASVLYLKKNFPNKKIYALGTESFKKELLESGINVTDKLEDDIDVLIMGYDTELTYRKLEDACILLGRGVDYVATNPDLVCPTEYGSAPDCGSVSIMLKNATGRTPYFIGKPEPAMINLCLEKTGIDVTDAIMVGDRLYTDIASGVNAGIDTALVLSGETDIKTAEESDIKPTYILNDISQLKI